MVNKKNVAWLCSHWLKIKVKAIHNVSKVKFLNSSLLINIYECLYLCDGKRFYFQLNIHRPFTLYNFLIFSPNMYKCQLKSQNAFISYASSYVWNFKSNWEYGSSQS